MTKQQAQRVILVHADKVPMVPNFGQQPRFIITIQPAGTHFNPPAAMTLPNVDGLAPGQKTEMYSFDHDLGMFVSIGPATVSEDGTVVQSDPGVGVIKGGWHSGGAPAPPADAEPVTVEILSSEGSGLGAQPLLQLEGERSARAAEAIATAEVISSENLLSVLVGEEVEVIAAGRPLPEGSPPFDWEFVDEDQQVVERVGVRPGQKTEDSLQSIVKLKGLQPGETTLKVTYRAGSGSESESEKEATAEVKVIVTQEEGAILLTNIQPTIVVPPRPAGFVQRHYPQGVLTNDGFVTDPNALSDLQLFYDIIATVQLSPAAVLNSVVNNMLAAVRRVIRETFGIEIALKPTPGFTVTPESFTPADREYLTLLFLERSTNRVSTQLPTEFSPEKLAEYSQTEYRQLHELRFEYHVDSEGKFKVFKEGPRKQFVGATPFRLPVLGFICVVPPDLPIICVAAGVIARLFPGQYVTGNLPVLTDQTGGEEETFIEQVLYSRAGATLRPFEDILLNFPGPAFFSEIRFNIDTRETPPLIFAPVVGHSPTHTWPSHYAYRWNTETKKYERAGAYPQTGQRGPFPGFIDVFTSPPGGVSSPTHKQCCPYPPG